MKRYLLLLPRLAHAIACVVVIMIATPLLALLDDRRRFHRGHNMIEVTNPENTPTENALLEVTDALNVAGAPRTDTERDGAGLNIELDLHARVRWLANDRDDKAKEAARKTSALKDARDQLASADRALRSAGAPMDELMTDQGATWVARELAEQCRRADEAEGHLSELHIQLRQTFDAESVAEALETARALKAKLVHFVAQRDAEVDQLRTGFMKQRDEAVKDRDFFKSEAERAVAEALAVTGQRDVLLRQREEAIEAMGVARETLLAANKELADRGAQLDALEVEILMLESHVDVIDDAIPGVDMWADWDLEP